MKRLSWSFLFYIPLIFLMIPVLSMYNTEFFVSTVLLSLLFAISYVICVRMSDHYIVNVAWLGLCIYICLFVNFSTGSSLFIFFQTNLLTYRFQYEPVKSFKWISFCVELILIWTVMLIKAPDFSMIFDIFILHVFAIILMIVTRQNLIKDALQSEIEEKNKAINLLIADNERHRIAKNLHDSLGHTFVLLSVKNQLIQTLLDYGNIDQAKVENESVQQLLSEAMTSVRKIIDHTTNQSLVDELTNIVGLLELSDMTGSINNHLNMQNLSIEVEEQLILLIKELVNNIFKHAKANEVHMALDESDDEYIIEVEDDGIGFRGSVKPVLKSIGDRLQMIKGDYHIVSLAKPTKIRIIIPKLKDV